MALVHLRLNISLLTQGGNNEYSLRIQQPVLRRSGFVGQFHERGSGPSAVQGSPLPKPDLGRGLDIHGVPWSVRIGDLPSGSGSVCGSQRGEMRGSKSISEHGSGLRVHLREDWTEYCRNGACRFVGRGYAGPGQLSGVQLGVWGCGDALRGTTGTKSTSINASPGVQPASVLQ